jgi:CelD/BcsL family acetyltransferase involved in cellulose biosynthesis
VNVEILKTIEEVISIRPEWIALSQEIPFRHPDWLLTWWTHYQDAGKQLFVVVARDDESRIRAIAPWYREKKNKSIRFLGDGKVCTDHLTILQEHRFSDRDAIDSIAARLVRCLNQADESWTELRLEGVDESDHAIQRLRNALEARNCTSHQENFTNTWRVHLEDGWEAFQAGVSKNARKAFRRRLETVEQSEVRWVKNQEDFEAFFPVLVDLHQKRRASLGSEGCFSDDRFTEFLKDSGIKLVEQGMLQAFSLWMSGKPIAADIGFRSKDSWMCYQAGIDPEAIDLQPGKMANVLMLRDAEKFGLKVVDFLRGDEPYKEQLKANPYSVYDLYLSPPTLTGSGRAMVRRGRCILKKWMNSRTTTKQTQ